MILYSFISVFLRVLICSYINQSVLTIWSNFSSNFSPKVCLRCLSIIPVSLQVSFVSSSSVLLRAFLTDGRGGSLGGVCPSGAYCPGGSALPVACDEGYYNSGMGGKDVSSCTACPPSYYCEGSGLSRVTGVCAAGYYCDGVASTPTQHVSDPGYYSLAEVRYCD